MYFIFLSCWTTIFPVIQHMVCLVDKFNVYQYMQQLSSWRDIHQVFIHVAWGSLSLWYLLCNIQSLSLSLGFSCDQHLLRTLASKLKLSFYKTQNWSESVYSLSTRKFISSLCFNSCINCRIFRLYRNLQCSLIKCSCRSCIIVVLRLDGGCIYNLTTWPLCAIYTMLLLMQLASPEMLHRNYLRPGQVGWGEGELPFKRTGVLVVHVPFRGWKYILGHLRVFGLGRSTEDYFCSTFSGIELKNMTKDQVFF